MIVNAGLRRFTGGSGRQSLSILLQSSLVPSRALGSPTPTFTRATTAYVWGYDAAAIIADGPVMLPVASGEARFMGARRVSEGVWSSVDADGIPLTTGNSASSVCCDASGPFGYLSEGARTNLFIQSNDFTNVAWVKTTMTTAKTSTGPDGVTNSATRLTASGATATVLQLLVAAASDRTWSVWARRVTGTGTIKLFQGATKTADLASQLNSTTYTQIQQDATVDIGILGAGIEIGTNTDAIDVWCGQFEAGAFASTPIPTTTASVTRNTDVLTYPSTGNFSASVGTIYAEFTLLSSASAATSRVVGSTDVGNRLLMYAHSAPSLRSWDGTNVATAAQTFVVNTIHKGATAWGGGALTTRSQTATSTAAFTGTMNATNAIRFGNDSSAALNLFGTIRNIRIYPTALSATQLQAMTA